MIVIYDDLTARKFEPFATTRPFCEMRAGALLIRERWERVLGVKASGFVSAEHLDGYSEFDSPTFVHGELPAGTWIVNSRALPQLSSSALQPGVISIAIADEVAAVRLNNPTPSSRLLAGDFTMSELASEQGLEAHDAASHQGTASLDGRWISAVWELVSTLSSQLESDIPALASLLKLRMLEPGSSNEGRVLGKHPVFVEDGAHIEPYVVFDAASGPILIRRDSTVQSFTRIVGPCFVGSGSVVTTDRIACCSIGDICKVHGELSCTIIIGHSNKGHDGFVGHSILGRWVNLGAGTITSNLKNTYGTVSLWTPDGVVNTGQQFLGTMFGDHAKTGIGLCLTTGTVIGAGANVFETMPPKVVRPFAWGNGAPYSAHSLDKFLESAGRMMGRRSIELAEPARKWWEAVHKHSAADSKWEAR